MGGQKYDTVKDELQKTEAESPETPQVIPEAPEVSPETLEYPEDDCA